MKKNHRLLPMSLLAVAVLAGCSTMPASDSLLVQARNDYGNAQSNPQVTSLAAGELRQASDSLDKANNASNKGENKDVVDHLAYVAKQQVAIAQETARQKAAELAVANASAERDRVRLDARTREADSAQRSAEFSQRQAEASQRQSEASQRQSEASQRQAEASQRGAQASQRHLEDSQRQLEESQRDAQALQRDAEASQRESARQLQAANDAQLNAQAARQQTQDAEGRTRVLETQLREMQAKKTDRGMVITLGDVLFDTDQAQLKSGGMRNVKKLGEFIKQYPQRRLMIEGFTDSTGTNRHNQDLSDQRAQSVRTALLDMGIGTERITSRGYGESYPAAGNDTAAGRQLNRRVEIVVSDDSGKISPR